MKMTLFFLPWLCLGCAVYGQNFTQAVTVGKTPQRLLLEHEAEKPDADSDGDGVGDRREALLGTNPQSRDTDGDGLPDGWELNYGFNPAAPDAVANVTYVPLILQVPAGFEGAEITELADDWAAGYAYDALTTTAARWNLKTGEVEAAGGDVDTFPYAINNAGLVVGTYGSLEGMVWGRGESARRLGAAPNHIFYARGVNSAGLVVGRNNSAVEGSGAFSWQHPGDVASNYSYLNPPTGYTRPLAVSINDRGQIAGSAHNAVGSRIGMIWSQGVPAPVTGLTGFFEIEHITASGGLVGHKDNRAFQWTPDRGMAQLPSAPFSGSSIAWKMNATGDAVGRIGAKYVVWRPRADGSYAPREIASDIDDPEIAAGHFFSINDRGEIGGGFDTAMATLPVILAPVALPELLVDADHDGFIRAANERSDDHTSPAEPYYFWVNDDRDSGEVKRSSDDDLPRPSDDDARNSANDKVDGIRDLEDFFPVYLDIGRLLALLPPGANGVSYRLRHAGASLGAVFTHLRRSEALDYLRGDVTKLTTGFGPDLSQPAGSAMVAKITAEGLDLAGIAPEFVRRTARGVGGVLLIEASAATTDPLVLAVCQGGETLIELKLHLKIVPVESMYSYQNLRSFAHGSDIDAEKRGPNYAVETPPSPDADPYAGRANRRNLIFVHGYNVNGTDARGWAATLFKRFHWAGSTARFTALLWRGDDGQGALGITPDYHRNVGHAWQQGFHFRDFLERVEGPTAIVAHSLGNVVTMTALTHARDPDHPDYFLRADRPKNVTDYFAIDAAVPLEALARNEIDATRRNNMRHASWRNYEQRLWPSEWFALFDPASDARSQLTWRDVFAGLDIGTNFYSSGEEILANPESDDTPLLETVIGGGLLSWVAQEKIKGGNATAAALFRSVTGGWGFNRDWYIKSSLQPGTFGYMPPRPRSAVQSTESDVPTAALCTDPFFGRFQATETENFYPGYEGSRLMTPTTEDAGDDEAGKIVTFAKCLGEAIPALSYAMGRNSVAGWTEFRRNFDLNEGYNPGARTGFKNGWPAVRSSSRYPARWLHSDCRDLAYIHSFPLFEKISSDAALK